MKNYAVGMKSKMHFTTFVQKKESVNNFDEFEIDECEQEDKEVPPQQSIQTIITNFCCLDKLDRFPMVRFLSTICHTGNGIYNKGEKAPGFNISSCCNVSIIQYL